MTRGVDSGDKTLNPTFSVIPCTDCGFRIPDYTAPPDAAAQFLQKVTSL